MPFRKRSPEGSAAGAGGLGGTTSGVTMGGATLRGGSASLG